ncbi:hypothetical protein OOT00_15955, partial [Desulfobotulus sp. H1]
MAWQRKKPGCGTPKRSWIRRVYISFANTPTATSHRERYSFHRAEILAMHNKTLFNLQAPPGHEPVPKEPYQMVTLKSEHTAVVVEWIRFTAPYPPPATITLAGPEGVELKERPPNPRGFEFPGGAYKGSQWGPVEVGIKTTYSRKVSGVSVPGTGEDALPDDATLAEGYIQSPRLKEALQEMMNRQRLKDDSIFLATGEPNRQIYWWLEPHTRIWRSRSQPFPADHPEKGFFSPSMFPSNIPEPWERPAHEYEHFMPPAVQEELYFQIAMAGGSG